MAPDHCLPIRKEKHIVLSEVKRLHELTLHALDGEVGRVDEILFDDRHRTVRYLIVETGDWLFGRKMLISPLAFGLLDWEKQTLNLNLTREQIENSPSVGTDKPVSRQWEQTYYDHYSWPYYWGSIGGRGPYSYSEAMLPRSMTYFETPPLAGDSPAQDQGDTHLHSTKAMTGYGISAIDGHLGHIEDFIVNDETWRISYLAVDTRNWWPGKQVLLPPDWIGQRNWVENTLEVNVIRNQVRNAPAWAPGQPIDQTFEASLNNYYAAQRHLDYVCDYQSVR
jgi:sporulation protein YlmC with PRC-barrel domain